MSPEQEGQRELESELLWAAMRSGPSELRVVIRRFPPWKGSAPCWGRLSQGLVLCQPMPLSLLSAHAGPGAGSVEEESESRSQEAGERPSRSCYLCRAFLLIRL